MTTSRSIDVTQGIALKAFMFSRLLFAGETQQVESVTVIARDLDAAKRAYFDSGLLDYTNAGWNYGHYGAIPGYAQGEALPL